MNIATQSRPWRRYTLLATLALAGLCALLYVGRGKYHQWRGEQLSRQANAFLEKRDLTSAALTAQRGLKEDLNSVGCWEVLAKVGEQYGRQPETVYAKSRILDLQKGSLDAALDCAETALQFGDPGSAANALGKVREDRREDARYQAMRGKVGVASGKLNEAVDGYARALKLDPQNEEYRLAHASAVLDRGWIEERQSARSTLERLSADPKHRLAALHALLKDSLANKEIGTSLPMARELAAAPGAAFGEKMIFLDLLRQAASPEFASTRDSLRKEAGGHPEEMAELELWMNQSGRFSEALEWAIHFTVEEWADPRVCAAVAANLFAKADWVGLELFTEAGHWQGLEYFRCALHARRAARARPVPRWQGRSGRRPSSPPGPGASCHRGAGPARRRLGLEYRADRCPACPRQRSQGSGLGVAHAPAIGHAQQEHAGVVGGHGSLHGNR